MAAKMSVRKLTTSRVGSILEMDMGPERSADGGISLDAFGMIRRLNDPLRDGLVEADRPGPVAPGTGARVLERVRVLIVEDHADTRDALTVMLETCGAEVVAVGSSEEAWPLVAGGSRPDVLVSDIGLPRQDGHAFIRRIRAHESHNVARHMPALALTADTAPGDRARALLSGFDRHVCKPIAFEELVDTISSLVGPRSAGGSIE
jgi:CheY-like chemotaxis protein